MDRLAFMTDITAARGYDDIPAFFAVGDETLFGVLAEPVGGENGKTVTMLTGGGYVTSTHRNRAYVRLARRLTALGYRSFRFDYHGTGESTGTVDAFNLEEPFVEDLRGAISWLEGRSLTQHVLVGSCFGARTALAAAPEVEELHGVVLISPPVRDAWWDPKTRRRIYRGEFDGADHGPKAVEASALFLEPLGRLIERAVPILVLYGEQEDLFAHFQEAEDGQLGRMLSSAGGVVQVRTLAGHVQGFTSLDVQDRVLRHVEEWLGSVES